MLVKDNEQRIAVARETVHRLLAEASSEKMMRHETRRALKNFREAEKLIDQHDLSEPWPSLCAYRMGHLLLRTASTDDELKEAKRNFDAARGSKCLGPLPEIYNLAVLYRLNKRGLETLRRPFEAAKQSIDRKMEKNPRLQDHVFNLLELASYFSGLNYEDLEGMGLQQNRSDRSSHWVLVGPDPLWANVVLSEAEALDELDELAKRMEDENVVYFKLSDKNSQSKGELRLHWRYKNEVWRKTSYQCLRLLALSLQQPSISKEELRILVLGDDALPNALARLKSRLKVALSDLTGISKETIYDESPSGFLNVTKALKIFGAVEYSTIRLKSDKL